MCCSKTTLQIRSTLFNRTCGADFTSVSLWLSEKKFIVINMFSTAALWGLWKLRNSLCFEEAFWKSMIVLLLKISVMVQGGALPTEASSGVQLQACRAKS
jgi:hypothetical protein